MTRMLGVGVLGLHEGCTMLVALTHSRPTRMTHAVYLPPHSAEATRAAHVRAVAGCDLNPEKIAAAQALCPDLFYTTSYTALLAREDIDIVAIYTPDALHADHIVQAFAAGKHVICTKPLLSSLADAQRVIAAAKQSGKRLMVGQSTRFFEPFRRQRAAVERGDVGQIELADAHYIHRMDWFYQKSDWARTEADWIFLGMSHPIDLLRWYLGPIAEVHAFARHSAVARQYQVRSEDLIILQLRAENGSLGRALGHYGLHELPRARNAIELVLYGSVGTSMAQYHDMRYIHTAPDGSEIVEDSLYEWRGYYFNHEMHGMHYGEFANYAEQFAMAILEDRPCSPDLSEGIEALALMQAARRSLDTGQPVAPSQLLAEYGLAGLI
jgi:predicted dehydrogenase